MATLEDIRKEAFKEAMLKLQFDTALSLETVIMGVPTGPIRDKLTEANIIIQQVLDRTKERAS